MVDIFNIRVQIRERLLQICDTVKMARPEGDMSLPFIVYAEITNVNVSKWMDRVNYQIDCYARTPEEVIDLIYKADASMRDLGFQRTYMSPDTVNREGKDLYHKAANYAANLDLYHENVINYFK